MKKEFEREDRYLVAKRKDVLAALTDKELLVLCELMGIVDAYHFSRKDRFLQCVCVESDWPEYEPVWAMIEKRVQNS